MNDEIREIYLSDLEWTKTHDNIGGVMGNIVFKDNMSYEEYRKLLKTTYFTLCDKDYITNLQQENEDYKSRVEKAVEYVNTNLTLVSILDGKKFYGLNDYKFSYQDLLNILQGNLNDE